MLGEIAELDGKYFVNPGSLTGAFSPYLEDKAVPSFALLSASGRTLQVYLYEDQGGKAPPTPSRRFQLGGPRGLGAGGTRQRSGRGSLL